TDEGSVYEVVAIPVTRCCGAENDPSRLKLGGAAASSKMYVVPPPSSFQVKVGIAVATTAPSDGDTRIGGGRRWARGDANAGEIDGARSAVPATIAPAQTTKPSQEPVRPTIR